MSTVFSTKADAIDYLVSTGYTKVKGNTWIREDAENNKKIINVVIKSRNKAYPYQLSSSVVDLYGKGGKVKRKKSKLKPHKTRIRKPVKAARKRKTLKRKTKGTKVMTALQKKYFGKGHGRVISGKTTKKRRRPAAKKTRRARSFSHPSQVIVMGSKKTRRARRRSPALMGFPGGNLVKRMGANALNVASGVAGGVAGAYVANMVPVTDARIKAAIPTLAGIFLASFAKIPALKFAGVGLGVMGGLSLVRAFLPGVGLLAGDIPLYLPASGSQMGELSDLSLGEVTDLSGMEGSTVGYVTQADM